ncbi:MAG: hypothetical protein RXR20_31390 [Paraburkholderia sp.]|jgi:hypothetical protein|uniref:hypothetical protein n=1 Tax=Burkholderiaceae TaxID=119060 RepID=UPI0010F737A2|nr:hypothetical protein [Burkholderia sp. 4M9327F10]
MTSLPFDALERIGTQLEYLNFLLTVYLCCKGVGYTSAVFMRRDPQKKLTREKLAQSRESQRWAKSGGKRR